MLTIHFPDMRAFERAVALDRSLGRYTLSLFDAAEALGVSRRYVHQLVRSAALSAVVVANSYVYLDPEDVACYRGQLRLQLKSMREEAVQDNDAVASAL